MRQRRQIRRPRHTGLGDRHHADKPHALTASAASHAVSQKSGRRSK
jgi:hypothetical protein